MTPAPALARACTAALVLFALTPAEAESDARAIEIAETVMSTMGGRDALEAIGGARFDFVVTRDGQELARNSHWWDRRTGDYRVIGVDRESGKPYTVDFNIHTREGSAELDGESLAADAAAERIERAYGSYINDTYWFLMPWKWLDPGVTLRYEGEREVDGELCDVVQLGFDAGVGLTSNDRYWALVSRATGRMLRWEYVLQDAEGNVGDGEPTVWSWEDWQETDSGLHVSQTKRRISDGPEVTISFPILELTATPPDGLAATH